MKKLVEPTFEKRLLTPQRGLTTQGFTRGFTLIEVLIVVAIIGILASIAYPSYSEHVLKTRRTEAKTELLNLASKMERFYANRGTYAGAEAQFVPGPTDQGLYSISIAETAISYTLSAAPANAQTNDPCGTLTLNSQGIKGAALPTLECW